MWWLRVVCVFTDIGACSLMVGVTCGALLSRVGDWCVGFVARCACSMAVLFPSFGQ